MDGRTCTYHRDRLDVTNGANRIQALLGENYKLFRDRKMFRRVYDLAGTRKSELRVFLNDVKTKLCRKIEMEEARHPAECVSFGHENVQHCAVG